MKPLKLEELEIRESSRDDWAAIETLYPEVFPEEDLLPLVRSLLNDTAVVALSLMGTIDTQIVGHVIFTKCGLVGQHVNAALLGPLAVAAAWQRKGIGSALVQDSLRRLRGSKMSRVFVLGDPDFYGRFGFVPETLIKPPYPLPPEWDGTWQSQCLAETSQPNAGALSVPSPWLQKSLWTP